MNGVSEQCHGTTDKHHQELQDGGAQQHEQADLQGTDALNAGFQGIIDGIRGVVRVRDKQFVQPPLETGVVHVRMSVVGVVGSGAVDDPHAVAWSARWCAGIPPSACSA